MELPRIKLSLTAAVVILLFGCSKEPPASPYSVGHDVRLLEPVVANDSPRKANPEVMPGPQELMLVDGRIFTNWRITNESSDSVFIKHSEGMAKVPKQVLPESLRSMYPINFHLARQEREKETRRMAMQMSRPPTGQQPRAVAAGATSRPISESEVNRQISDRGDLMQAIREKAQERAKNFFTYEFEPTSTSRILAFDVSVAPEDPEPWAGIPGRYTVDGKGHLQFHQRHRGIDRETRGFRVHIDVAGNSMKVARFELR